MIKIIDNALEGMSFSELGTGATFKFQNSHYLVIDEMNTDFGRHFNAVKLDTGLLTEFDDCDIVIPFNCELIIL